MNLDDITRRFPNASASFIRANLSAGDTGKNSQPQHSAGAVPLAKTEAQETNSERILIRIVSVRKRLLDPDNSFPKWQIDCLRYCGIIRGDEPDKLVLETTQRRCEKGEAEHTVISIYTL